MNEKLTREDVLGHRDYWFKAPKTVDPRTSAELVAICDLALSALDAQATDTRLREIAVMKELIAAHEDEDVEYADSHAYTPEEMQRHHAAVDRLSRARDAYYALSASNEGGK